MLENFKNETFKKCILLLAKSKTNVNALFIRITLNRLKLAYTVYRTQK